MTENVDLREAERASQAVELRNEARDRPQRAITRAVRATGAELIVEDHRPIVAERGEPVPTTLYQTRPPGISTNPSPGVSCEVDSDQATAVTRIKDAASPAMRRKRRYVMLWDLLGRSRVRPRRSSPRW